ncbi:MAG TPA: SGNH/GDSL hydrolase family protein [Allosphingosinicella sp.]|jgi:lysophospholipase L1-like esterase|nr:SGNH/GDSL hydrolase family protein [Allosphingosinicella sp.]
MFAPLLLLAVAAAQAPTPRPLPVHVQGRVIHEADGSLSFGWPGVSFESRFRGTGIRVRFDAPTDFLRLLVDGKEKMVFRRPGAVDRVIGGLSKGVHVVRLEKMTESQQGGSRFVGFFPTPGDVPLPAPARRRQIEFIGDSYTVGYGNISPSRTCTRDEVHDRTDTQQAFGPLVARHYGADDRIIAYSGFGIVRNYNGGSPGLNLPKLYDRLKPDDDRHLETATVGWHPQVIVINLGTNDFSTPVHTGEAWRDADALAAAYHAGYLAFLRKLLARQPQARFILMGSDFYRDVEQVAAALDPASRARVTTLRFGELQLTGCDYHPSTADDRTLASLIEGAIDQLGLGWTTNRLE